MDVSKYIQCISTWIYPARCVLCGEPGTRNSGHSHLLDLCIYCEQRLPYNQNACPGCAAPLPGDMSGLKGLRCGRCTTVPYAFDSVISPFCYEQPVSWMIGQLKFNEKLSFARLLGEILAEHVVNCLAERDASSTDPECILPVPLHDKRLKNRGFNQSVELARPVSCRTGLPLELNMIKRVRETEAQATLGLKQRQSNLKAAFENKQFKRYRSVAIVDDVITTAATVNELALVLKKSGVEHVEVWCIARA